MIENIAKISGGRCADITIERTSYGIKIRQKSSFIALTVAMFDELVSVVDDMEDADDDDSVREFPDSVRESPPRSPTGGKLGELYTSPAVTPAKYCAGGRP
jgi:hypothetical protein